MAPEIGEIGNQCDAEFFSNDDLISKYVEEHSEAFKEEFYNSWRELEVESSNIPSRNGYIDRLFKPIESIFPHTSVMGFEAYEKDGRIVLDTVIESRIPLDHPLNEIIGKVNKQLIREGNEVLKGLDPNRKYKEIYELLCSTEGMMIVDIKPIGNYIYFISRESVEVDRGDYKSRMFKYLKGLCERVKKSK